MGCSSTKRPKRYSNTIFAWRVFNHANLCSAHIFMSPKTHRQISSSIAIATGCKVFVPDYRLCPETPYPGAIEDVLAAYVSLTNDEELIPGSKCTFKSSLEKKMVPKHIFIMGDSSGACLSLQLLSVISTLAVQQPSGLVLISPFLDHEMKSESWTRNAEFDFMSLDPVGVKWAMGIYSNGLKLSSLSPFRHLSAVQGSILPPVLIQAGDSEVVTDDALDFTKTARKSENFSSVDLELFNDMFHVFHTFPHLHESSVAFKRISNFVDKAKAETTVDSIESDSGVSVECGSGASVKIFVGRNGNECEQVI